MKKIGLYLGQRKKLNKYINYFNTLKIERPIEQKLILLTKESNIEEVPIFLKQILNFSEDSINIMMEEEYDGEALIFTIEEYWIEDPNIKEEEKNSLKNYLNIESIEEEVFKFLKCKLNFRDESIKNMNESNFDAESLFLLEENDIQELVEISEEEKIKLK